ncbi:MAG: ADP-ribosylglycohydrolase family protein [Mogibacterium sp.]|nr:ADP-ribosylglycohydrolase family protein [Mogibacterium sp.]
MDKNAFTELAAMVLLGEIVGGAYGNAASGRKREDLYKKPVLKLKRGAACSVSPQVTAAAMQSGPRDAAEVASAAALDGAIRRDLAGVHDLAESGGVKTALALMPPVALALFARGVRDQAAVIQAVRQTVGQESTDEVVIMGCCIYVQYLIRLLAGNPDAEYASPKMFRETFAEVQNLDHSEFSEFAGTTFRCLLDRAFCDLPIADVQSSFSVVDILECAVWCLANTENYREAIVGVVNLGGDAETTGAVTGALYCALAKRRGVVEDMAEPIRGAQSLLAAAAAFSDRLFG